jgi:peroxiredoxin
MIKCSKSLLITTLVAFLWGGMAGFQPRISDAAQGGLRAKDFTLKDVKSKTMKLSDLRGRVVLLNFFSTWCPPCRIEIPELIKIYQKYNKKNVLVVGVSLDTEDVPKIVQDYVRDMKIPYPVLIGNMELAGEYQVSAVPTLFLIDKKGKITKRFDGVVPNSKIEKVIKVLIDQ